MACTALEPRSAPMKRNCHRRDFLHVAGASLLVPLMEPSLRAATTNPSAPVSIARCTSYVPAILLEQLRTMMDQLGGIGPLVAGKTVGIKVNLTGDPRKTALGLPSGRSFQVHPSL